MKEEEEDVILITEAGGTRIAELVVVDSSDSAMTQSTRMTTTQARVQQEEKEVEGAMAGRRARARITVAAVTIVINSEIAETIIIRHRNTWTGWRREVEQQGEQ